MEAVGLETVRHLAHIGVFMLQIGAYKRDAIRLKKYLKSKNTPQYAKNLCAFVC
jgi:hypothetical protein